MKEIKAIALKDEGILQKIRARELGKGSQMQRPLDYGGQCSMTAN